MSNQEVWITICIRSEIDDEIDAVEFSKELADSIVKNRGYSPEEYNFLFNTHQVDVLEVLEERHIYGPAEDKPYRLEE